MNSLMRTPLAVVPPPQTATAAVVYRGPSVLTGTPIVAVLVWHSSNGKTGDMVQLHILVGDRNPVGALADGSDVAVCGDCPARPANGGFCYVVVGQGPATVYKTMAAGKYPTIPAAVAADVLRGRKLRVGAYGDPAALPRAVLEPLIAASVGWTAYTHQWRRPDAAWLKAYAMASVETPLGYAQAKVAGWRTFYAALEGEEPGLFGVECPYTRSGRQCVDCMACDGHRGKESGRRADIRVTVHGAVAKTAAFRRWRAAVSA